MPAEDATAQIAEEALSSVQPPTEQAEPEQPPEAADSDSAKWDEFAKAFDEEEPADDGEEELAPPPDAQPSTPEAEEPAVEEPEPEPPPIAAEQPPEPEPVQAEAKVEEPVPETPAEPAPTQTPEQMAEMRAQAEEQLTKYYALSEDDAEALRDAPHDVLPKIAAKLYLDVYDAVMKGMQGVLPQMVAGINQQTTQVQRAEQAFFGKWSKLDTQEGRAAVDRIGRAYRQVNPRASLDQFINDVGLQASIQLRLPIEGYGGQEVQVAQPPQQIPPQPASATSAPRLVSAASQNPFTQLANEFMEEERF